MSGARMVRDNRAAVRAALREAGVKALAESAEFLLEQSNRTAPIEEATLIRSGEVSVDADALKAAVSYDTPYAVRQHEDQTLRHDEGRRAKWLEATFKEQAPTVGKRIAKAMKAAM